MSSKTNNIKKVEEVLEKMSISAQMKTQRIALTCAPGGENHRGNQLIGRMPKEGEGFSANDIDGIAEHLSTYRTGIENLDLNTLSDINVDEFKKLPEKHHAKVLILRNYGRNLTQKIFQECMSDTWDSKYLDPNKYTTVMIDGKEVRKRGKVMNKRARKNICYAKSINQNPEYLEGKGTIVDLEMKQALNSIVNLLKVEIECALIACNSKSLVEINVVEGNWYYNLKKTGIGFHGDTERVVVICITIGGGGNYPMRWQWFKNGLPVGNPIDVSLNDGDVYIMSEKAVGADWKKRSLWTLRHAAGADKYRSLSKWQKRIAVKKK